MIARNNYYYVNHIKFLTEQEQAISRISA